MRTTTGQMDYALASADNAWRWQLKLVRARDGSLAVVDDDGDWLATFAPGPDGALAAQPGPWLVWAMGEQAQQAAVHHLDQWLRLREWWRGYAAIPWYLFPTVG